MTELDDFRRDFLDDGALEDEEEFALADSRESGGSATLFLGMTPVERMFISIFLFMNVAVLGVALLLATGRIG